MNFFQKCFSSSQENNEVCLFIYLFVCLFWKPKTQQGFDIGGNYCIEIEKGDVERLLVVDFARLGGGKGNWLGMNT
jgi:hypothetical protein